MTPFWRHLCRWLVCVCVLGASPGAAHAADAADLTDAVAATQAGFDAAKDSAKEGKEKLEKALETYKTIKEYVSGAKGTEAIDRLLNTRGIEDHTKLTELRGKLQDVLRKLDQAGLESKLEHATKILGQFESIAGEASDAVKFMERFNPEGARGDPTRGLRIIGAAIEDAAGGLPWPMDEIFKEYAKSTTAFATRLDDLSKKINQNTRQGSLGGSYAGYAEAQEFFEKNFEGRAGRSSATFFDVSSEFALLGKTTQVFQDLGGAAHEYYVFSLDDARGSLVPPAFASVYRYFAALPDVSVIPPLERVARLSARATSNGLNDQIAEAERLRRLFDASRADKEPLLRALNAWDELGVLLLYGADAFVGFFLLIPERHAAIERVRAALEEHVFVTGNVVDAKDQSAANVELRLSITGKGASVARTGPDGAYVVVAPGLPGDAFVLSAGTPGEAQPKQGNFDERRMQRGVDFKLSSTLQIVRIFVVDKKTQDALDPALVNLGGLSATTASGSAVFEVPPGTWSGTASAADHKSKGFSVDVGAPEGLKRAIGGAWQQLPGFVQSGLRLAARVAPVLSPETVLTVALAGENDADDDAGAGDGGDAGSGKFAVSLAAPKTQLEPGERVTASALPSSGTPPFVYAWTLDGLAMPARNEPTLPLAFGKLGHHFVGVTAKDSATPPAEAAATLDLVVGKTNDPDLVGRWEGTATVLEFKSDMPEVDAVARGKSGPATLWIAPDGLGNLKMVASGGQGFFCNPAEVARREGEHVRIDWDGPSHLPQTAMLTSTSKCTVDIVQEAGRLKGTAASAVTAVMTLPNLPVQKSTSSVKTAFDLGKVSPNPGPPPGAPAVPAGAVPTPTPAPAATGR